MKRWARIEAGVVREIIKRHDKFKIDKAFHPEVAATFVAIPDGAAAEVNGTYDGRVFGPPPPAEKPEPDELLVIKAALLDRGVITDADIEATRSALRTSRA